MSNPLKFPFTLKPISLLLSSLLFSPLFITESARANLYLSPMYLQLESQQVQTTGSLNVGNTSNIPIRVRISTVSFSYNEDGKFIEEEHDWNLTPYIRVSPREISIPPKSFRNIRFAAVLPPSLPDGEYRVAIFAESLTPTELTVDPEAEQSSTQTTRVNYLMRIGSAIYIKKGTTATNLQITNASFNPETQELRLNVNNQGTATAKTQITWQLRRQGEIIRNGKGSDAFLPGHQLNALLQPDQGQTWSDIPSGRYQLTGELTWQEKTPKTLPFSVDVDL